jgi:hypothetical protein
MMSMSGRITELLLWVLTAGFAAVGGFRVRGAMPAVDTGRPVVQSAPVLPSYAARDSLGTAAAFTADHNPFRLNRQPAMAGAVSGSSVAAPPAPRPVLLLRGLVGASPAWQAILEGIPGRAGGVVVSKGDTVGGLRVRRITRDTVIVQGTDTTWKLTVKRQ